MINISGLDKAEVLQALYGATRPLTMGIFYDKPDMLSDDQAAELIRLGQAGDLGRRPMYFDYVGGRPIKSDLSGDEFDPRLFDRDAGQGAAARAIEELRAKTNKAEVQP